MGSPVDNPGSKKNPPAAPPKPAKPAKPKTGGTTGQANNNNNNSNNNQTTQRWKDQVARNEATVQNGNKYSNTWSQSGPIDQTFEKNQALDKSDVHNGNSFGYPPS